MRDNKAWHIELRQNLALPLQQVLGGNPPWELCSQKPAQAPGKCPDPTSTRPTNRQATQSQTCKGPMLVPCGFSNCPYKVGELIGDLWGLLS